MGEHGSTRPGLEGVGRMDPPSLVSFGGQARAVDLMDEMDLMDAMDPLSLPSFGGQPRVIRLCGIYADSGGENS